MEALPPATAAKDAFDAAISLDEVEAQLHHVKAGSAPGLDGIGYAYLQALCSTTPSAAACSFQVLLAPQARAWKLEGGDCAAPVKEGQLDEPQQLETNLSSTGGVQVVCWHSRSALSDGGER
jgi:hypothetical protein